jgi:hypothetical protein
MAWTGKNACPTSRRREFAVFVVGFSAVPVSILKDADRDAALAKAGEGGNNLVSQQPL